MERRDLTENVIDDCQERACQSRDDHQVLALLPGQLTLQRKNGHTWRRKKSKSHGGKNILSVESDLAYR